MFAGTLVYQVETSDSENDTITITLDASRVKFKGKAFQFIEA